MVMKSVYIWWLFDLDMIGRDWLDIVCSGVFKVFNIMNFWDSVCFGYELVVL